MRTFAESFFAEALLVNLTCKRPYPLLYSLDLSAVGGQPEDIPNASVPDSTALRDLVVHSRVYADAD